MTSRKILTTIFIVLALAIVIAGVFAAQPVNFAMAEQAQNPWNVDVEIRYGKDVFKYDLRSRIPTSDGEADDRGFYLGCNGKKALADRLLGIGLPNVAAYEYVLPGFKQIVERFGYVSRQRIDADISFSANGFAYSNSQDGVEIDVDKLFERMIASRGKHIVTSLPLIVDKAVTADDLKKNAVLKSSFTTTYYNSSANRCFNVALAAKSVDGITVRAGEEFSFNAVVGERTEANGYKSAKVISNGAYVDGIGGGVCQVSTTLYNALLLAGFVPKATRHTLVSSYVMAGFDAMVADNAVDLTFVNNTSHDIYIQGRTADKKVTFTIYGEPNEYTIVCENVEQRQPFETKEIVDVDKYPELVYSDQIKVVTGGSDGVKSQSYLKYYKDGKLVNTRLIRTDTYKRVDRVIARGPNPREQTDGSFVLPRE